jgi:hypothetical protein
LRWVARIDGSHHAASISDFLVRARVAGAAAAIGLAFERLVTEVHPTNTRFIRDLQSIVRDLVRAKPTSSDLLRLARIDRAPMPARHHLIAALAARKVKGSIDFVDELLDDRTFSETPVLGLRIIRSFRLENKRERVIALSRSAQPKVRKAAEKTLEELDRVVS